MTTIDFTEAIAELVRQFPTKNTEDVSFAMRQCRGLTAATDRKPMPQESLPDDVEWFDNFPI